MAAQRKPNLTPHEDKEQENLLIWAAWNSGKYPELTLLYHIANGGKRGKREAARLKAQGVKAGVPDLHLPVARGGYHSLYIELKRREGGTVSDAQKGWIADLRREGNCVAVCRGSEEAERVIVGYLGGKVDEKGNDKRNTGEPACKGADEAADRREERECGPGSEEGV